MLVGIYTRGNKCSALFLLNIKITEISKKFLFLNFCKCGHSYEKNDDFDKDNNDDIYYDAMFVCVSVTKNHHFPLPEAQIEPPARPRRP